ncbi:hypothetical protein HDA40_002660 [Hamadaea flava]|uniref:Uncharacterized protein n=1 Tax=Hamadaea flava TaxID=1742688 RepID=A0ABV8LL41_9ACTN|nr:hypothetical protein [Hamadaea flava]MCP2324153.1 hypothetical protein [Hamadaea flava]
MADALALNEADRAGLIERARAGRAESTAGWLRVGQLPRGLGDFVGRADELSLLTAAADKASAGDPTPVFVVHGAGGWVRPRWLSERPSSCAIDFPTGSCT